MTTTIDMDFDSMVRDNWPRWVAFASVIVGNWNDAEDIAQEAIILAWTRRDEFDPAKSDRFAGWVSGFVRMIALNNRTRRGHTVPVGGWEDEFGFEFEDKPAEPSNLPCIAEDGTRNRVAKALHRLPARERQAIELHVLRGLSTKDSAAMLGVTPSSIRQALKAGLARLAVDPDVQQANDRPVMYHLRLGVDSTHAETFRAHPELVDSLSPCLRDVVKLRYFQQKPRAVVAKRLGLSVNSVGEYIRRARRAIDRALPDLVTA